MAALSQPFYLTCCLSAACMESSLSTLEYLESISKFKFETSIYKEVKKFKSGFYKYIPRDVICLFNSDEFSLLLNGVGIIDVNDWYNNTLYEHGVTKDCDQVKWFWSLVRSLKLEEKSLLLKFTTGSPCLPIGGFKNLMGLSGLTLFTIVGSQRNDKLPLASTCFNRLSLPRYSSEKMLREKVLIAIRHGCEGFTFGWLVDIAIRHGCEGFTFGWLVDMTCEFRGCWFLLIG